MAGGRDRRGDMTTQLEAALMDLRQKLERAEAKIAILETQVQSLRGELIEALEFLLVSCSDGGEDGWVCSGVHPASRWAGEMLVRMGAWERRTGLPGGAGMDRQWYRKVARPEEESLQG